jgi:archaellum component FlaF (FlaF/FlaG flagellin family)
LHSGRGDRGIVLIVVDRFVLGWRSVAAGRVKSAMIEPVDVLQGGQFELVETAPRAGTTSRVSVSSTGTQANDISFVPAISGNGRYVAFTSAASNLVPGDTNGAVDVFVRDRRAGTTSRVSVSSTGAQANGYSYDPAMSADGRYVGFDSDASNLVPGDTNGVNDVFLRNLNG